MSNREAKFQARQWVESPDILAEDLRRLFVWIDNNVFTDVSGSELLPKGSRTIATSNAEQALALLKENDNSLWEYRRILPETRIKYKMLQPLMECLIAVVESSTEDAKTVQFNGRTALEECVVAVEQWAKTQAYKASDVPLRSELLKVTIEQVGDEIIVRTDKDGSLKIRGTTNIPMFLTFWRANKHHLSKDAFMDIDPGSKLTYLDRHRARLCAQLQSILLEVVAEGNGFVMRRCRA